jgi:hypothetical protein
MRILFSVTLLVLLLTTTKGFAQYPDCDAVLAKDTVVSHTSDRVSLAALSLVTKDNFQSFQNNFTGGLTFPIDGIPISANTTYDQFSQERQSYLNKYSYNYNYDSNQSIALSYTSDAAIAAWTACIQSHEQEVLILRPIFSVGDTIIVQAKWIPGNDLKPGERKDYTVTGGTVVGSVPSTFLGGWTSIKFKRTSGDPAFSFDINMKNGGTSGHIEFPALSSAIIQGDLNCKSWVAAGCITYVLPLPNLQHMPVGGNGIAYTVRGMVPHVSLRVSGQIGFTIDEYPTASDEQFYIFSTQIDNGPQDTHQWGKHWGAQPPITALVNSLGTVAPTGIVGITFTLQNCYWANPVTTTPNYGCHVSAPQNSSVTLDALTMLNTAADILLSQP